MYGKVTSRRTSTSRCRPPGRPNTSRAILSRRLIRLIRLEQIRITCSISLFPLGTRKNCFRDAKEANYFNGDFTFKKHAVATTGKKTLTYLDPIRHFETAYDYSENRAIQEITDIFVGISATIEHGRKLQFLHRFDKLGLEDELKGMESAVENHNLAELQIIAPTLQSIADDTTILNIARQRAKRLLAKAKSE